MYKFVITSEMRVGSRWLHYLLADLLGMQLSGEIDGTKIKEKGWIIQGYFKQNKIPKFHHAHQYQILTDLQPKDYKIIAVVRNPRDRAVSVAFHHKYQTRTKKEWPTFDDIKKIESDKEAVKAVVMSSWFSGNNIRMFKNMEFGYSTMRKFKFALPYIWTSYEWLTENTFREIKRLCQFLGANLGAKKIKEVIQKHSFKVKSGREPGQEMRESLWRRKGVNGDWKNWFDFMMVKQTESVQKTYLATLSKERYGI